MTISLDVETVLSQEILNEFVVIDSRDAPLPSYAPKNLPPFRTFIPKDPAKLEREGRSHLPDMYGGVPKQETWEQYHKRMADRVILQEYLSETMKRSLRGEE